MFEGRGLYQRATHPNEKTLSAGKVYFDSFEFLYSTNDIDRRFETLVKKGTAQESDLAERLAMELLNLQRNTPQTAKKRYRENTIVLYKTFDGYDLNMSCQFEVKSKKCKYEDMDEKLDDLDAMKVIGIHITKTNKGKELFGVPMTKKQLDFLEENQQVYVVHIGWAIKPNGGVKFWAYKVFDEHTLSSTVTRPRNLFNMAIKKSTT